jgi:hypothetical protein
VAPSLAIVEPAHGASGRTAWKPHAPSGAKPLGTSVAPTGAQALPFATGRVPGPHSATDGGSEPGEPAGVGPALEHAAMPTVSKEANRARRTAMF